MAEYIISRVSSAPPREWSFDDKRTGRKIPMETYKVMFEGEEDPISVNRKPGDKPTVGEVLNGSIEENDYGKKFKKAPNPSGKFQPKDTSEIKAEWAIGQAVTLTLSQGAVNLDKNIEDWANKLYIMVDRVKAPKADESGYEKAKLAAQKIKEKQTFSDGSPVDEIFPETETINLDDIPF